MAQSEEEQYTSMASMEVRRDIRATMTKSVLSVVLALALVGVVCFPRIGGGSGTASAAGTFMAREGAQPAGHAANKLEGWHRTSMGCPVRKDVAPDSVVVADLPAGSVVYISQVLGNEAHIVEPAEGWVSNVAALFPSPAAGMDDPATVAKILNEQRDAAVQAKIDKLKQLQKKMAETTAMLRQRSPDQVAGHVKDKVVEGVKGRLNHPAAAKVKEQAPKVVVDIVKGAKQAVPEDAKKLVQDLAKKKDIMDFFKNIK